MGHKSKEFWWYSPKERHHYFRYFWLLRYHCSSRRDVDTFSVRTTKHQMLPWALDYQITTSLPRSAKIRWNNRDIEAIHQFTTFFGRSTWDFLQQTFFTVGSKVRLKSGSEVSIISAASRARQWNTAPWRRRSCKHRTSSKDLLESTIYMLVIGTHDWAPSLQAF